MFNTLITASCVSVKFSETEVKRASGVEFKEPPPPYVSFESNLLDAAWSHPHNGSSISFLSDCSTDSDPTLADIQNGILSGIKEKTIETIEKIKYNGRQGLRTTVTGNVDGITSKVNILIFKKNGCIYNLTLVSLPKNYNQSLIDFNEFVNRFRAP